MIRIIAVVFIIWPFTALAEPVSAQAEELFRQGRFFMEAGKFAEACSAFEQSQKLEPAVTTLLNLAACREKLGQFATAWGLFLDVSRQTRSATDAENRQFHDIATVRAQTLEPRVSKLTINVPLKSQFDGLQITRGMERIDAGLWNRALPIDGGTYTITARAPGANQWTTQVTVAAENDTKTVEIPDLRNLPRDLGKSAAHSRPPAVTPIGSGEVVPLVIGAGAAALLGGGLGFELWARSTYDAAKSEMTSQSRRESLYNSANTGRHVAQALALSGLAAGGAAVWWYLRDRNRERDTPADMRVHVLPTVTGVAVFGRF